MALLHFSFLDWFVVVLYGAMLLVLGFRGGRAKRQSAEEFVLGGRALTVPSFVAALVSTWYGGILGVGEFTWSFGLSNWVVFGLPYYLFAAVFALFFAEKVRRSESLTIPEAFHRSYGRSAGMLAGVLVFLNATPAPYFLMLAILLQVLTGWPLLACLFVGTVWTVVYLFTGGLRSVVRTDIFQFILMFAGFILLLAYVIPDHGDLSFLATHLPLGHLTLMGTHSVQYILVWFFIALWTLVAPQFHQFTLSARDGRTARRGILVSIGFWFLFDTLTTVSGLYARALLPNLSEPTMAYPLLAEHALPSLAKGLFYVGMLATVMSTADGLTFISGVTFGRDVLSRIPRPWRVSVRGSSEPGQEGNRQMLLGVALAVVTSVVAIQYVPSVINLWYVIGTLFIPPLLLPLIAIYYPAIRISARWTLLSMICACVVAAAAFIAGQFMGGGSEPAYPFGIEPMYSGIACSVSVHLAGLVQRRYSP
jgi:solute:Na+ symporter, SSS family